MGIVQLRLIAAIFVVGLLFLFATNVGADAADGPNQVTPSDIAAGQWMDSLLGPDVPRQRSAPANRARPQRRIAQRGAGLRGKLVNNPNTSDGSPPYALVDRYGGVLRYVEPVSSVDLEQHLGKAVAVRHDTGDILLASQLALPRRSRNGLPRNGGSAGATSDLQLAQNLEPIPAGEPVPAGEPTPAGEIIDGGDNGPIYMDGGYEGGYEGEYIGEYGEGLNFGGCPDCGDAACGGGLGGCGRGARGKAYLRGEYLLWSFKGMRVPALVTGDSSGVPFGTPPNDNGTLPNFPGDNPNTVILFGGNDDILDDARSGGRIQFGFWLDDFARQGIEFDYLRFETVNDNFFAAGEDGLPTISRPFFALFVDEDGDGVFDNPPGQPTQAIEQVSSDILDGSVTVLIESDFESFGIRMRHNLCCSSSCCPSGCGSGVGCGGGIGCGSGVVGGGETRRIDLLTGFRYASLDESIRIMEDLTADANDTGNTVGLPVDGTTFDVRDAFATENEFLGGEIGFLWEIQRRRWSLELLSKLAIGSTRQQVRINGRTTQTPPAGVAGLVADEGVGGLLAQVTNIGTYEKDEFSVMPELNFTLGYRLTPRLRLTAGYNLLFWTNVLRPGDHIDLDVNTALLPEFDTATGALIPLADPIPTPLRPEFDFVNTDIWAQGINLGAEYTW